MFLSSIKDDKLHALFEYVGVLFLGYTIFKSSMRLFNNLGTFFMGIGSLNLKKYGSWAVVTGCTDGIGKAYAETLAKRGLNVVLISRTLEKLQEQAKSIEDTYKVETKVISADFTEQSTIYDKIRTELKDLDIGILINNVGMSYKHPEFFDIYAQSDKTVNDIINCNITSLTKMTAIVLPIMVKKNKGIIVNNASASGRIPTPLLTVYSATKAYVDFFSRGLNVEYKSKGIVVQSLCPYFVSTKLSAMKSSFTAPKPNVYVKEALKTLGSQSVTNGCLIHNIQGWLFESVIPSNLMEKISYSHLLSARSRALAKIKKQQAASSKTD